MKDKGVDIAEVTLHVGLGTFRPVKEENVLEHEMHSEYYQVTEEAAEKIAKELNADVLIGLWPSMLPQLKKLFS